MGTTEGPGATLARPWAAAWLLLAAIAAQAGAPPSGPFTHSQCLECHTQTTPSLVQQWRDGPHGSTDCSACHGPDHGALPKSRHDQTCVACHGGLIAHSYQGSKHGAIASIERPRIDLGLPLQRGNYRVPGCAYCHLHAGDHGDGMAASRGPSSREWICSGCHAPRFVADQLAAGRGLMEIGDLKRQEALAIAARHPGGPQAVQALLEPLQRHLANLRLGWGHQSPDYQWWHGQPALDGDLIRLRDAVEMARRRAE